MSKYVEKWKDEATSSVFHSSRPVQCLYLSTPFNLLVDWGLYWPQLCMMVQCLLSYCMAFYLNYCQIYARYKHWTGWNVMDYWIIVHFVYHYTFFLQHTCPVVFHPIYLLNILKLYSNGGIHNNTLSISANLVHSLQK